MDYLHSAPEQLQYTTALIRLGCQLHLDQEYEWAVITASRGEL